MIPAIEYRIYTDNSTLKGDMDIFTPSKQDGRVVDKAYKLYVFSNLAGIEMGGIEGSIKCLDLNDVEIVCNNMVNLAEKNEAKIGEGSFIGIHYCRQLEVDKPVESCTLDKLWSK